MKRIATIVLIVSLLSLTACGDKEAEIYAGKLVLVLEAYRKEVDKKIAAEQQAYNQLNKSYRRAKDEDILQSLSIERTARSTKIADALLSKPCTPISYSDIQGFLQDYANEDFEATRSMLEQELSVRTQFLSDLENLEFESNKVKALIESLNNLTKPKNKMQQFKELAQFGQTVEKEFNGLLCKDLTTQKSAMEQKSQEIAGQIKGIDDNIAAEKDEEKKKQLMKERNDLEAEQTRLQGTISKLQQQMQNKNCL